jgi:polyisoprenyl-phosphate glycosyltransferase
MIDVVDICVVVPAYNEAANLEAFHREATAVLRELNVSWRFLFVDDGSRDATSEVLERLRAADERVTFIRLARNFGLQSALTAGLAHAVGRAVVIMDADLQDDPAALREFIDAWRNGADVVYAVRSARQEGVIRRTAVAAFYRLMSAAAEIPIPRDAGSFALYDRKVVASLNALPERNRYLPGLRAWVGYNQVPIRVPRRTRFAGQPVQSMGRLVSLALDGVLSFSKAPLRLATTMGFAVTFLSAVALVVVLYWRFVQRSFPSGVGLATIALSLFFLSGVQLLLFGVVGEYVGRVYDEVKQRPHYVVAERNGADERGGGPG